MRFYGVLVGLLAALHLAQANQPPVGKNKAPSASVASVACSLGTDTLTMTFFLDVADSNLGQVYLVNATDVSKTTLNTFSTSAGGINGSGTDNDPFKFSIVANVNQTLNLLELPAESEQRMAFVENSVNLTVHVMAKSNLSLDGTQFAQEIVFQDDILYIATCDMDSLESILVSTGQINTTGFVDESPQPSSQKLTLRVFSASRKGDTTSVALGERIYLIMDAPLPTDIKSFKPHSCSACDVADCTGNDRYGLLDASGCSNGYMGEFTSDGNALAKISGTFESFTFVSQSYMYFVCSARVCFDANDTNCAASTECGKPNFVKRSVDEAYEEGVVLTSTYLKITAIGNEVEITQLGENPGSPVLRKNTHAEKQKEMMVSNALIGGVVGLAVLLAAGAVASIVVFRRLSARKSPSG